MRFLESIDEYFLLQEIRGPRRRGMMLDLVYTKKAAWWGMGSSSATLAAVSKESTQQTSYTGFHWREDVGSSYICLVGYHRT